MKVIERKVVLLGSPGVGKTSLLLKYVNNTINNHGGPTIGASFFSFNVFIRDIKVILHVWDTAGMERFRSMAPMYYRKAQAALLVFDLTNNDTFTNVKGWVAELKRNIEEAIILILVGNKSDRVEERVVDFEEACTYATSIGASYHETSALFGDGIESVFVTTASKMLSLTDDEDLNRSIKVYGLETQDMPLTPSSEEDFHNNSIAHGIYEKPFFCC